MSKMGDQGYPATHTTVTTTQVTVIRPYFDPSYVTTIPGILKVAQSVFDFICFICIVAGPRPHYPGAGWAEFVSIVSFIVTTILLVMYLMHLIEILHIIPWLLVEMCYCALWSFFYLIAASVIAAGADTFKDRYNSGAWAAAAEGVYCVLWVIFYLAAVSVLIHGIRTYVYTAAYGAACFFGFLLMFLYGVDVYFKFRAWRNGDLPQGGAPVAGAQVTTTTSYSSAIDPPYNPRNP